MRKFLSSRVRKNRAILEVMELERRVNPSVPVGLLDVPSLLLGPIHNGDGTLGYKETHTIQKSFSHAITLDESGTGSSGTYTLDVVGSAHATNTASGGGGLVSSTSGHLTSDISYHIVIDGSYSDYGFTVDSESYTETGFVAEDHTVTYLPTSDGTVSAYDGTYTRTWSLGQKRGRAEKGTLLILTAYPPKSMMSPFLPWSRANRSAPRG
jgi:hypothetical protein